MSMMHLIILLVFILFAVLLYSRHKLSKFSKAGVNHLPTFPLIGNTGKPLMRMENLIYQITKLYQTYPDDSFVGFYELMNPLLIIKDVELLKRIAIKDFHCFSDRRSFTDVFNDPLFRRNLLLLKGEEWKAMRYTLSPVFASSKIRLMLPIIVEIADKFIETLKNKMLKANYIDIECKELSALYANDVIATCMFGVDVESLEQGNQFYEYCKQMTSFSFKHLLKVLTFRTYPRLFNILRLSLSSEESREYYKRLLLGNMNYSEENNSVRSAIIQLLLETKKGVLAHNDNKAKDSDDGFGAVDKTAVGQKGHKDWTTDDIISQAIIFVLAGFETIPTVMAFALYELAMHPEVQERLVHEIKENIAENDGKKTKVDYESIQRMKYLDMVISEVLRLWPPSPTADRICTKDYNLGKPNSKAREDYIIRRGDSIQISIWAIHRDPKFFPEPEKFDPERFSDENRSKIQPYAYIPFGIGPRNCIGSRFASCILKVWLCKLLQQFEVSPCEKTSITGKLRSGCIRVRLQEGHWIKVKVRQ